MVLGQLFPNSVCTKPQHAPTRTKSLCCLSLGACTGSSCFRPRLSRVPLPEGPEVHTGLSYLILTWTSGQPHRGETDTGGDVSKEGLRGSWGAPRNGGLQVVTEEPSLVQEADGALTTKRTPPELGGTWSHGCSWTRHGWERGNGGHWTLSCRVPGTHRHQVAKCVPISAISLGPG